MTIIWTPSADFAHLLNEVGLKERDLGVHSYYISIGDMRDVRVAWCPWKRRCVLDLWHKYSAETQYDFKCLRGEVVVLYTFP